MTTTKILKNPRWMSIEKCQERAKVIGFGAFFEGNMVGNLGVFYEQELARYQSIGTNPDFRRRGICGTLVYKAGQIASPGIWDPLSSYGS